MNIGDSFNGLKILEIQNTDGPFRKRRYLVHRKCCDSEMWLGHNRLCVIKRMDHDSKCKSCDEESQARSARQHNYLDQQEKVDRIDVPGWGQTLGKMGMR